MSESEIPDIEVTENVISDPAPEAKTSRLIRQRVTPDPFHVDPALLGKKLGTPMQRGFALLIDLTCVAVFSSLGISFLIAIAGYFFARYANREYKGATRRMSAMLGYCVLIIGLFFFAFGQIWNFGDSDSASEDGLISAEDLVKLAVGDEAEVRSSARLIGEDAHDSADVADLEKVKADFKEALDLIPMTDDRKVWILEGLMSGIAETGDNSGPKVDVAEDELSLTRSHVESLEGIDGSAGVESTREALKTFLAGAEMDALKAEAKSTRDELETLKGQLKSVKKPWAVSILTQAKALAEDVGITFFWSTLYFTSLVGLFRGRTIGKRLMRLRVVRLDGRKLTVWNAFERHGGYLAGVATGLLGFFQILWDPNRQTIEDKIAGTVVIRD